MKTIVTALLAGTADAAWETRRTIIATFWPNPLDLWNECCEHMMSGHFKKAKVHMCTPDDCHCAMGVMCEVVGYPKLGDSQFRWGATCLPMELAAHLDVQPGLQFKPENAFAVVTRMVPLQKAQIWSIGALNDQTDWTLPQIGSWMYKNRAAFRPFLPLDEG